MKNWKDIFVPYERRFRAYLVEQAETTRDGVELLHTIVSESQCGDVLPEWIENMSSLEKRGDFVRQKIIQALQETFVTPFDREDIYALSRAVDDILDYADSTVKELTLYQVVPTGAMVEMVATLCSAIDHLLQAISALESSEDQSTSEVVLAKKMENQMEELYRRANAQLFNETDIHYIFKVREIYRHLSNSADRVDDAADIIGAIMIKGNI